MTNAQPRARLSRRSLRALLVALSVVLAASIVAGSVLAQEAVEAGGGEAAEGGFSVEGLAPRAKIARVRGLQSHVPEVHTVRTGDTLWGITAMYFRNPYLWPALWSYNPHITNPHWIYPQDIVFLKPPGTPGSDASIRDLFAFSRELGVMIIPVGYYNEDDLSKAGRVLFSPEEKTMLTAHDEAYVDWEDLEERKHATPGQRFMIYHPMQAVVDQETEEEVAQKLKLVGTLQLVYNDGQTLPTGVISDAVEEIERGDLLLPYDQGLFRLMPTTNGVDAEGTIIDTFALISQLGEQQFALVDKGSEDGVGVGNRFFVFEQREGIVKLAVGDERHTTEEGKKEEEKLDEEEKEEREKSYERPGSRNWPMGVQPQAPTFPEEDIDDEEAESFPNNREYTLADLPMRQVGEAVVVKTSKHFSTILIVDSRHELQVGNRVTMLAGF